MNELDELTGVLERAAFLQNLDRALAKTAEDKSNLTLLFLDIDHLKPFNDSFGHVAGDQLIRDVAHRIAETFGSENLVGRYGGDEFLASVTGQSVNAVYETAEQMRLAIEKAGITVSTNEGPVHSPCTLSIGCAAYPSDGNRIDELIDKAKQALYRAKESGGNSLCFYEEKDGLTDLYNHFGALRKLEEVLAQAQRKGESVSIVFLDIDHFETFNHSYGHRTGDYLIKRIANILKANFKENAIVGRYGGDEFIVILPDCRADSAFVLVEEVRKLVEDTDLNVSIGPETLTIQFRVSGGIATFPTDASEKIDLLRKADEALYRAKNLGRNRICLPTSSQMVTKTSHFTQTQLERLASLAKSLDKSEAFLLREALDMLFRQYDESPNIVIGKE